MASIAATLLVFLLVAPITTYATTYKVVWNLVTDYSSWASKDIFVGDQIEFSYDLSHSVLAVNQTAYSNCDTGNPSFSDSSGKTTYKFTKQGAVYFICGSLGHCPGMQLKVNVQASSSGPTSPGPTPSPPRSSPTSQPHSTASSDNNAAASRGLLSWVILGLSVLLGSFFTFNC